MILRNIYGGAICLLIFIVAVSCADKKFEKRGWTARTDANFPPAERKEMLSDLLANYKMVGMKYGDIISLLGAPDGFDGSSLSYEIEVDYGSDIDPVYRKDLYFFTTKDSVISSYEIKEWEKE